jgi:hypothetical protein
MVALVGEEYLDLIGEHLSYSWEGNGISRMSAPSTSAMDGLLSSVQRD